MAMATMANSEETLHQNSTSSKDIILHPLVDLSCSHPQIFVHDLKRNFIHREGRSTAKFREIRKQITQSLPTSPFPGPATFVARCIGSLALLEPRYREGLGHLLISAINHLLRENSQQEDLLFARNLAASLVYAAVLGTKAIDDRVIVKVIEVFGVQLSDILKYFKNEEESKILAVFIDPLILKLIKENSLKSAVTLTMSLCLQKYVSLDFIANIVNDGDVQVAAKWAACLGKDMLCSFVQHLLEVGMLKDAYKYATNYQLRKKFPVVRHVGKNNYVPPFLVKGVWDKEGYFLDEQRHSLTCSKGASLQDETNSHTTFYAGPYLQLDDIIALDKVIWVDNRERLDQAMKQFNEASVVAIDCEWKPFGKKGSHLNKVLILQMATRAFVFIFDLIHLVQTESIALNACIQNVFSSPRILKLGYAIYNDLEQLLQSYHELECFHHCERVLDLQVVAGDVRKGGLSGLTQMTLGRALDKGIRMTDWSQRPLSTEQIRYAALDAAVLIHIFDHIDSSERINSNWKSHVDCFRAKKILFKT